MKLKKLYHFVINIGTIRLCVKSHLHPCQFKRYWKPNSTYFNYTKKRQLLLATDLGHAGMSSGSLQNGSWYLQ